jgi:hypothetical protein
VEKKKTKKKKRIGKVNYKKRVCSECGAPCTSKRCMSCFKKGRKQTISRMYSMRGRRERETIRNTEKDLNQNKITKP